MEIQAVVTDLDRTLLRTDKTVSAYTLRVLRGCVRCGLRVVLATARPVRTVRPLGLEGLYHGAVCHNGAVVRAGGKAVASAGIEAGVALEIIQGVLARCPAAWASAEMDDALYANFEVESCWPGTQAVRTHFASLPGTMVDKVIFSRLDREALEALKARLPVWLYLETDREGLSFIMNRRANKLEGVRALLANWGLAPAQAVAFGDDRNDVAMLAGCGLGVAVCNATSEARQAAGAVCGTNDEDGVAHWLEDNLPARARAGGVEEEI